MFAALKRVLPRRLRQSSLTAFRALTDDNIEHLADDLCGTDLSGTDLSAWRLAEAAEDVREAA